MRLNVLTATGKRGTLELAAASDGGTTTAAALQLAVGRCLGLPAVAACRLRLVCGGQPVDTDAAVGRLKDGDTLVAVVAPRPPPEGVRQLAAGCGQGAGHGDDDEDDAIELRLRLPANAPRWKRAAARFLQRRLRLPEGLVALLLQVGARWWLGLLAWMAGARAAAHYDHGPLYIITTIFLMIFLNLGTRGEGDQWSAYSLFNRGHRALPGQLTAEDLDRQVRQGTM